MDIHMAGQTLHTSSQYINIIKMSELSLQSTSLLLIFAFIICVIVLFGLLYFLKIKHDYDTLELLLLLLAEKRGESITQLLSELHTAERRRGKKKQTEKAKTETTRREEGNEDREKRSMVEKKAEERGEEKQAEKGESEGVENVENVVEELERYSDSLDNIFREYENEDEKKEEENDRDVEGGKEGGEEGGEEEGFEGSSRGENCWSFSGSL